MYTHYRRCKVRVINHNIPTLSVRFAWVPVETCLVGATVRLQFPDVEADYEIIDLDTLVVEAHIVPYTMSMPIPGVL